ncbi:MAG: molybdopterin-dependent oxidoreductase [Euryarchaeota archaeon]|nr:molybdopterin-dependent oxidoreductase [Euryarchaeota archaeon]MBU4491955.1 molybdopterin-dependent oxidoreductase [Euryarchaeota archaeon]MCG2728575.1 molybdopterin-dependent oxidoreductase [Candidatus Methanoperedenaceae archaeon]
MEPDVLFAYNFDDKPPEPTHEEPLRLVVPKKYAYKCADPWKEERYSD